MKRTFELYEIEGSMLPIFFDEEWKQIENLTDISIDSEVTAYGYDSLSQKYLPLYHV